MKHLRLPALLALVCVPAVLYGDPTTAVAWRALADRCVGRRAFAQAADAYRHAAAIYTRIGDAGAAKILSTEAERYETDLRVYIEKPADAADVARYYTHARLEPVYGAYIGAFVDREDGIGGQYVDENFQSHLGCEDFNDAIGKDHAIFFMYMRYGGRFPRRWTDHLRAAGAAAQLVLSPDSMDQVNDERYLRYLAQEARRSGVPIFLRFAGEMNGDWVPYHGDPARYIAAFRRVAAVFHAEAPNVAMVWCVNDVPEDQIPRYFPGDDAVDWVGVNFYSVPFNNGDAKQPADWRNPADSLRFVYHTYAARHPIMVGEYAASHLSRVDRRPNVDFAIDKIGQLYSALPRLYPRVKAIHWLSMNTFRHARPDRQLNDYSLLEDPLLAAQYRAMTASGYFLSRVSADRPALARTEIAPLARGAVLSGTVKLSAWVKSYEPRPLVTYVVRGRPLRAFSLPGAYELALDTRTLPNGPTTLQLVAYDHWGRLAGQTSVPIVVRN